MRFIFSRRFYILFALGIVPLSLSWSFASLAYAIVIYDILLVGVALTDYFVSRRLPEGFAVSREFDGRFAIGDATKVSVFVDNASQRNLHLRVKDEYPSEMKLEETRGAAFTVDAQGAAEFFYHLTPPKRGRYEFGKTAIRYLSRLGLVWCQAELGEPQQVKGHPNMRRARP